MVSFKIKELLYRFTLFLSMVGFVFSTTMAFVPSTVKAQVEQPELTNTEYFSQEVVQTENGDILIETIINGPSKPPAGFLRPEAKFTDPVIQATPVMLSGVPTFDWVFGCSAVSGGMIAGYYDRNGFPNVYTGPTNGGVVPLTSSIWGTWTDGVDVYPNNPLIASKNGLDGRLTRGSIDDYWVEYLSEAVDPYITGGWAQHTWSDAVGDYMKTSQSAYSNVDGSTSFYSYSTATPLQCSYLEDNGYVRDGTLSYSQFYKARGYSIDQCYFQRTSNNVTGGFSLAQYRAEIDAGYPVMIHVEGHTMVGVGYDADSDTIYIHDTWDYSVHQMPWGGSYVGLPMWGVSIVHPIVPTAVELLDFSATRRKNAVVLEWETASELDTVGFNLYRSRTKMVSSARSTMSSSPPLRHPVASPGRFTPTGIRPPEQVCSIFTGWKRWILRGEQPCTDLKEPGVFPGKALKINSPFFRGVFFYYHAQNRLEDIVDQLRQLAGDLLWGSADPLLFRSRVLASANPETVVGDPASPVQSGSVPSCAASHTVMRVGSAALAFRRWSIKRGSLHPDLTDTTQGSGTSSIS